MARLLESGVGRGFQRVLRRAEKIVPLGLGKERDLYEKQQQLLRNPETRSQYIQSLGERVRALVPQEFLPQESTLCRYQPTPEMFLNPQQVYDSQHTIAHHAIVMEGALLGTGYLKAHEPEKYVDFNEQAVAIASALHDTQRRNDGRDSISIQGHGHIAANRLDELLLMMHAVVNKPTHALTEQMLEFHDVDRKQLGPKYTPELGVMVAADRAALGRLFDSKRGSFELMAGGIAALRMRRFKNGGIAAQPDVFKVLTDVESALDIMVKEKVARGDKTKMFDYFLESVRELGIVKADSPQEFAA